MRRRFKRSSRCDTGKVRYPNELEAGKALKRAAAGRHQRGELNHVERRFYRCRRCGGFHLSSQPRKA
jgi:CO dehydrogenase/acetyl-CoA synthase alpha subunit